MQTTGSALRTVVIAISAAEVLLGLAYIGLMLQATDPLGKSIAQGMAMLVAVPLLGLSAPALVLGIAGRWLCAGLALAILALPVVVVLWGMA